jgi:hypothetical protein
MIPTLSQNYQEINGKPIHLGNVLLLTDGWTTEDYKLYGVTDLDQA